MTSNPQPDSNQGLPDAVSFEQLQQLARQARASSGAMPRGTKIPDMPGPDNDSGIFDLAFAIEQLVMSSGGTTMMQMLHAVSYMLSMSISQLSEMADQLDREVLSRIMTELCLRGQLPEPNEAIAAHTKHQMQEQVRLLESASILISQVLKPITGVHITERGARPDRVDRKIMMSDAALDALGIERDAFDQFFGQYFG